MYKHISPPRFYRKGLCVQATLNSAIFLPDAYVLGLQVWASTPDSIFFFNYLVLLVKWFKNVPYVNINSNKDY